MSESLTPLNILKKYWGYEEFKLNQEEIISSVLSDNDTIGLMPTGGGKSICYQVPALIKKGVCIVISPLISLMIDQVEDLQRRGIAAKYICSGMSKGEIEVILNNCLYSKIKLLYISPERISSETFISHFKKMKVSFIVVDEAHCLSQWGYDFRPSYMKIIDIRDYHPDIPLLALTASATEEVLVDISSKLMKSPFRFFTSSFERNNLIYAAYYEYDNNKIAKIIKILERIEGSGIIYVRSRNKATIINALLNNHNVSSMAYHAGMTMAERNHNQNYWIENKTRVIVATTAFGMGINKPDVRFIIHYDIPQSIENYFQEVGRAGRDGQKSYCVLLYNDNDKKELISFTRNRYPELDSIKKIYNAIGNYCNVPILTGKDRRFDWDILEFSHTYNYQPYIVANAIKIMENSQLFSVVENLNTFSKVKIICSKPNLYNFISQHPSYEPLLITLIRLYPFIMIDFVNINERDISKLIYETEDSIHKSLMTLEKYEILYFDQKSKNPQILFLENRLPDSNFSLSQETYHRMKEINIKKANQIINYIESDQCRQEYLLKYFSINSISCNKCDNCLTKRAKTNRKSIEEKIIESLEYSPKQISYFSDNNEFGRKEIIIPIIRDMIDKEILTFKNGLIYINN